MLPSLPSGYLWGELGFEGCKLQHLTGTLGLQGAPFGGVAEELLGGKSAAAGIALVFGAAEFSSLAVSALCEGSRASSEH